MTLSEYIESIGDEQAAKLFRVPVRTVQSWRRRERSPRPDKAMELVKLTNGAVQFQDCYPFDNRAS